MMLLIDRFHRIAADLRESAAALLSRVQQLQSQGRFTAEDVAAVVRDTDRLVAQLNAFVHLVEGELNEWGTYAPDAAASLRKSLQEARQLMERLRS